MLFLNPKWRLLGNSGVMVTPALVWPATPLDIVSTKWMRMEVFIAGYASGGAIGRICMGSASATIDTGATCATSVLEGTTLTSTSVNATGVPLGGTNINGPRSAEADFYNVASVVKRIVGRADGSSVSAGTAPLNISVAGIWVNTAAVIKCLQLQSWSGVTGSGGSPSGTNFSAGTEWSIWGKDDA